MIYSKSSGILAVCKNMHLYLSVCKSIYMFSPRFVASETSNNYNKKVKVWQMTENILLFVSTTQWTRRQLFSKLFLSLTKKSCL